MTRPPQGHAQAVPAGVPSLRPALDSGATSAHISANPIDGRKGTAMTRRILIIEDDAETAAYVRNGFEEAGFTVVSADNGRDGLYLATGGGIDAIILDRMLHLGKGRT